MNQTYTKPVAGGEWEHKSGDCAHHGVNIAFAKPYKSTQPWLCVACMLSFTQRLAAKEERARAEASKR